MKKKRYIAHLKKEIGEFFLNQNPAFHFSKEENGTIYFGGGTPSVLSIQEIGDILDCFPYEGKREISFECNPEDINEAYVEGLLNLGINRISLGIQSLNDKTLKAIHRSSKQSIFEALAFIEEVLQKSQPKIFSLNVDFILGLPFSKPGETLKNIELLHKKYPFITHTSVYMLEDGLYPKDWKEYSMNETEMENEYTTICGYFESIQWNHYEISNWAKPGYECNHNQGYWNHTNYRGFGLSATSFVDSMRWENSASFTGYYSGKLSYEETLTKDQMKLEKIIHGLRTFSLSSKGFNEKKIEELKKDGFIKIRENKIVLTQAGIFRENFILSELIH